MQNSKIVKRFIYLLKHETQLGSVSFVWTHQINTDLKQLISILLSCGALLHVEKCSTASEFLNVYINYQRGMPARQCSNPFQLRNTNKFLHHQTIYRFLMMRPGATVLVSTQRGLLTASECVKQRLGGFFFCAVI